MSKYIKADEFAAWFTKLIGTERPAKVARILGVNREAIYWMKDAKKNYRPREETMARLGLTPMFRVDNPPDFTQPDPRDAIKAKRRGKKKE